MTLRSKLTLAFFGISVVPLACVTLFSYYSSGQALRRAAEQQATTLAGELGRRMEWVTADLERRMQRVWPVPESQAAATSGMPERRAPGSGRAGALQAPQDAQRASATSAENMTGHLAGVLGDVAPMIESIELMPGAPRPAGAPPPPPPPREAAGTPPVPAPPPGAYAIEMSRVIDQAMEPYKRGGRGGQLDWAEWSKAVAQRVRQATAGVPTAEDIAQLTRQARAAERDAARLRQQAERAEAERLRATTQIKGSEVNSSLQRDGQVVGRIHARLNMPRLFRAILPTRREQGEIGFAIDADGNVHAPDADKPTITTLKTTGVIPTGGTVTRSGGDWVVVTREGPGGMTFGIARPLAKDLRDLRNVAVRNFAAGFGLIALVFVASVPLAGGMTRNLRTLMAGVDGITRGDLTTRVPVRSRDEFGQLASAFNRMTEGLAAHERLVVQQERLQRELELCRQIQNEMLPHEPLRLGLAEIKGVSIPAREVGGDFFNYFALPSGDIAVLVGDVSGKGVGAALLMANIQATLRARLPREQDLARLVDDLDRELAANTPPEVYLTMFVGIVNPHTRTLRYVSAGHNTQFILRREGIDGLPSTGRPLGLLPGGGYEERSMQLPDGDLLFFYTDGIVEAENESGDIFGPDRLEAVLRASRTPGAGVDNVLVRVETAVREFRGRAEPLDDATMMALCFGNRGNA